MKKTVETFEFLFSAFVGMALTLGLALFLAASFVGVTAEAKTNETNKAESSQPNKKAAAGAKSAVKGSAISKAENGKLKFKKLSTDVRFDDQLVGGKYHYPDEAVATVEDEKSLNNLLGMRMNFKDRLSQSSVRQ